MAEAVGVVAAATQLLDLSVRALSASYRLYDKYKSVPDEINTLKGSLIQFKSILEIIKDSHTSPVLPNGTFNTFSPLISKATRELTETLDVLEGISFCSSGSIRRAWDVAVSSKTRRKVAERCRRIESLKPDLIILHEHYRGLIFKEQMMSQSTDLLANVNSGFRSLEHRLSRDIESLRQHFSDLVVPEITTQKLRPRASWNHACDCYPSCEDTTLSFSNFHLFFSKKRYHFEACSHWDKPTLWSLGFRILSPRLQVMLGIRLGSSLSLFQEISPHNIVDPGSSSAFKAFYETREKLDSITRSANTWPSFGFSLENSTSNGLTVEMLVYDPVASSTQRKIIEAFQTLHQKLLTAFTTGTACPNDRTTKNVTILHLVVELAMDFIGMHECLYAVLDGLIKLLVDRNRDPNALSQPFGKVDIYTKSPCLLCLAVGWPTGLKLLLGIGANPEDAIETAINEGHIPSIELLLDYDCGIFPGCPGTTRKSSYDLIDIAMMHRCPADIFCLLIKKLVERRKSLASLAMENLPSPDLVRFGLQLKTRKRDQPLLDHHALEVFQCLEAAGIQVSVSMWPGKKPSIYHRNGMTYSVAKRFWEVGFRDIDIVSPVNMMNRTPLWDSISNHYFAFAEVPERVRLIRWYLEKGAKLPEEPSEKLLLFLRSWAGVLVSKIWVTQDITLLGPLEFFRQLHPEGILKLENGTCRCSPGGCIPAGTVLQDQDTSSDLIERWCWLFHLPRMEIFDRLGMAHTCRSPLEVDWETNPNDEEVQELEEEDKFLELALDSHVRLYADLLQQYRSNFEPFWLSWWITLEHHLPFETHHNLRLPKAFDFKEKEMSIFKSESYQPNIEGISSMVEFYFSSFSNETMVEFLSQFKILS
ncbi:hypothetical protein FALBO_939 [Fusarium albosuccineum]|uniref:Fungal N-terminal domain-containing protein n=1 Tax=Fusarium albosuccineum TaxID=1237068 RepID=A0A8H4LMK7_9HYPO|nr:hypothetical protein FALBO_939 [Fusarium albosuccineum]